MEKGKEPVIYISDDETTTDDSEEEVELNNGEMMNAPEEKAKSDAVKLAELKDAKRKWENRQSAARSRKRKAESKAKLETEINTLRTQRAALVDREALCKKDVDALKHKSTQLRSNVEVIQKKNLLLYLRYADLRIKAGQVDPNSGPPGMIVPFGVPHNNYAQNSGPPGMQQQQQAAQAYARMQQQQQTRLVPPRRTLMLLEGADAGGSDAEGGDDAPGQGP